MDITDIQEVYLGSKSFTGERSHCSSACQHRLTESYYS